MIKAHNGAIFNCDLVQQTPPDLRQKAMRVISGKYVIPLAGHLTLSSGPLMLKAAVGTCPGARSLPASTASTNAATVRPLLPAHPASRPTLCPDCRSVFRIAGSHGKKLRDEILHKIEKWQEPPPAKQIKPIALPDDTVRKRRGGKR